MLNKLYCHTVRALTYIGLQSLMASGFCSKTPWTLSFFQKPLNRFLSKHSSNLQARTRSLASSALPMQFLAAGGHSCGNTGHPPLHASHITVTVHAVDLSRTPPGGYQQRSTSRRSNPSSSAQGMITEALGGTGNDVNFWRHSK